MKKIRKYVERLLRLPLYWLVALVRRQQTLSVEHLRKRPPRSILFIRLDGIGDVVLSLATIQAFHELYPQAELSVLIYQHSVELIERLPEVKRIFVYERTHWTRVVRVAWRLWRNRCEWSVHLTHTNCWTPGFLAVLGGTIPISFHKPHGEAFFDVMIPAPHAHTFKKQEALVRAFGYAEPFRIPVISLADVDTSILRRLPRATTPTQPPRYRVGLYVGNAIRAARERWSLQQHAALARQLVETLACQIVILWGPNECTLASSFADAVQELTPQPWMHPPTSLREMALLLSHLNVVVTPATGPLHLAESVRTPVVALCGQRAYDGWRPLDPYHRVVCTAAENLDEITVETVLSCVKEILASKANTTYAIVSVTDLPSDVHDDCKL